MITPERFKGVLGRLAGGVALVTSRRADGRPCGMTATAVSSVSLEPPLVLACLDLGTTTHGAIEETGIFGVNLLSEGDEALAVRFGRDDPEKFRDLEFTTDVTGAPLLPGTLGYCDCSVVQAVPAGDHTVFIGRVEAASLREARESRPLVYYRGRYGTLAVESGAAAD